MKNNRDKYCLLTNDVETTSIWHNSLRDETGKRVVEEGMPVLLDLYEKYDIKSTFFFTGYIAKLFPEVVKMVIDQGHEVASHGMSHHREDGFDVMPPEKQRSHLKESKKLLEDISGQQVVSFRAPALRINKHTIPALEEAGYKYDSSVASQRFDMFMSFGGIKKLNWLIAPRLPYKPSRDSFYKKGGSSIIEVPLSACLLPYVGTTMRILPLITSVQRRFLSIESRKTGKPIVFDIHPNEFIDESHEERLRVKRSSNPVSGMLQDNLRRRLKVRNLGQAGAALYENQIAYFSRRGFRFTTIKDYCENLDLQ